MIKFWHHDVLTILCDVMTCFLAYDVLLYYDGIYILLDVMRYFLKLWRTFWHNNIFDWCYDICICFDVPTYVLRVRCTRLRHYVLPNVITYFFTSWRTLRSFWCAFLGHDDVILHATTYILMSWRTFSHHDILYVFFGVISIPSIPFHTFWHYDSLMAWCTFWRYDVNWSYVIYDQYFNVITYFPYFSTSLRIFKVKHKMWNLFHRR